MRAGEGRTCEEVRENSGVLASREGRVWGGLKRKEGI